MANPTRIEINCETGEVQEIELTDKEVADLEAARVKAEAEQKAAEAAAKAKAEARAAIAEKLGLSEDELATLIG